MESVLVSRVGSNVSRACSSQHLELLPQQPHPRQSPPQAAGGRRPGFALHPVGERDGGSEQQRRAGGC